MSDPDGGRPRPPGAHGPAAEGEFLRRLVECGRSHGRPATRAILARLPTLLRRRRYPPDHPAPWRAAALGLVTPREAAPHAFQAAEAVVYRLRKHDRCARSRVFTRLGERTRNPALVTCLIEESRRQLGGDLDELESWLDLATEVVSGLTDAGFPPEPLAPMQLRLIAHRANFLRLCGDLPLAAALFRVIAVDPRRPDWLGSSQEAELLNLEGSLRMDFRDFASAIRLYARAERLYLGACDLEGLLWMLLQQGSAHEYAGDPAAAEGCLLRAGLECPRDQKLLALMINKNLANVLVTLGRTADAAALLAQHRALLDEHGDEVERARWKWVEARLARAEERFAEADRLLAEVREVFLALGRHYDAALAILDATEVRFALGDWEQVREAAALLAPVFAAQGVHREQLAALAYLREAAEREALTAGLVGQVRRFLQLGRNDPQFQFAPGGRRRHWLNPAGPATLGSLPRRAPGAPLPG